MKAVIERNGYRWRLRTLEEIGGEVLEAEPLGLNESAWEYVAHSLDSKGRDTGLDHRLDAIVRELRAKLA